MNSSRIQAPEGVKVQPGTDTPRLQSADTCFFVCLSSCVNSILL